MKTIGIIGGLGPETTAKFYLEVIKGCEQKSRIQRPPMLIWNVPLMYSLEDEVLLEGKDVERLIPILVEAAQILQQGGADFLVIPCNTVHLFIEEVRNSVKIPVISIVEETTNLLNNNGVSNVGLLATGITIDQKLYGDSLEAASIVYTVPIESDQKVLGQIIHNLVNNKREPDDQTKYNTIIDHLLSKGSKTLLLACTDLQLLDNKFPNVEVYDTMNILVNSTIEKLLD